MLFRYEERSAPLGGGVSLSSYTVPSELTCCSFAFAKDQVDGAITTSLVSASWLRAECWFTTLRGNGHLDFNPNNISDARKGLYFWVVTGCFDPRDLGLTHSK